VLAAPRPAVARDRTPERLPGLLVTARCRLAGCCLVDGSLSQNRVSTFPQVYIAPRLSGTSTT
jgi:hypothetical protein